MKRQICCAALTLLVPRSTCRTCSSYAGPIIRIHCTWRETKSPFYILKGALRFFAHLKTSAPSENKCTESDKNGVYAVKTILYFHIFGQNIILILLSYNGALAEYLIYPSLCFAFLLFSASVWCLK